MSCSLAVNHPKYIADRNFLHTSVFRNEQSDGYLGAVSQLISQSFEHGGEGSGDAAAA